VAFETLLDVRFVGSQEGSTVRELVRAIEEHGGHALAIDNLSADALRAAAHPMILHVRRPGHQTTYSHWVLFLGVEDGQARLLDPPEEMETIPLAELLALWDGTAILVAPGPPSLLSLRVASWTWFVASLLGCAALLVLARQIGSASRLSPRVFPYLALPSLVVVAAMLSHLLWPEGFFRNRGAIAQVAGRYFEPPLTRLDFTQTRQMMKEGAILLDARTPDAFQYDHLPDALNWPISASLSERNRLFARLPAERPVIVYCQSSGCTWAATVASDLILRGHSKVYVYRGGVNDWFSQEVADAR
jgi:rhodanese-related sulfurtransferase